MDKDVAVPLIGRYEEDLRREYGVDANEVWVSPFDLSPNFEVELVDGTPPQQENVGLLKEVWMSLMQVEGAASSVLEQVDLGRLLQHIARAGGSSSYPEFLKKGGGAVVNVVPDEQVQEMAQRGDIAPVEEVYPQQGGRYGIA